jgi:hypothetical protein
VTVTHLSTVEGEEVVTMAEVMKRAAEKIDLAALDIVPPAQKVPNGGTHFGGIGRE